MSDKTATELIKALGVEFPQHVIRMKPGSNKRPAMPYVSHGSVTKRLNDVCPDWSSRVVETHTYLNGNGMLVCVGVTLELTIPGLGSRQEFGTAAQPRDFGTDAKNAMSDALKRCAMRFGVALDLWESADEDDEDAIDYAGSQTPYQKDGGGFAPFTPNTPPRATSAARSNGTAPPRVPTPPAAQRARPQPLNAAAVGAPYDEAEYERLSRQVRTNDDALSPAEYTRYHELDRLRKERFQAAQTGAQEPGDLTANLLARIRDDTASPEFRRKALHTYFNAATDAGVLAARRALVDTSGLPAEDITKLYDWHRERLMGQPAPKHEVS